MAASQSHRSLFTVSLIWETGSPTTFCISSITCHDKQWPGLNQVQANVCFVYETLFVYKGHIVHILKQNCIQLHILHRCSQLGMYSIYKSSVYSSHFPLPLKMTIKLLYTIKLMLCRVYGPARWFVSQHNGELWIKHEQSCTVYRQCC